MIEVRHLNDRMKEAFTFYYDEARNAMVLKPLDPEILFPFYIDHTAGFYQINETAAEKLLMVK